MELGIQTGPGAVGGVGSSRASPQMLTGSFPVTLYSKDISLPMLFLMTK